MPDFGKLGYRSSTKSRDMGSASLPHPVLTPVRWPSVSCRLLVADADADTRALYGALFVGCEVTDAVDGREALTKALMEPPTLLITELRLPLIDGVALCTILRRDTVTRSVPILVVTADTRVVAQERILKVGANAVLVKPVSPDDVLHEVQRLLMPPSDRRGAGRPLEVAPAQEPTGPRRTMLAKSHARFSTSAPPAPPPVLRCPGCDRTLDYQHSYVGGVSRRHPEQWDYYRCATCGTYQYRQRTRKLRRVH